MDQNDGGRADAATRKAIRGTAREKTDADPDPKPAGRLNGVSRRSPKLPAANASVLVPPPVVEACVEAGPADDVLVAEGQRGDQEAFRLLIERHQRAIYGYLRARVLTPSDAEDLCQDVFLRSYQTPAVFDGAVMVRPWLLGIARNVLREHVRKSTRRKEVAWTSLCLEVDEHTTPEDDRYDDVVGHLPGCLDGLGDSARDALDMYYRSKLRLAQIGERLRRSEGAVKLLMYRARQALKNCLTKKTGCALTPGEQETVG